MGLGRASSMRLPPARCVQGSELEVTMKLLLAIDILDRPEVVLEAAADWARRLDATIDLLYADDLPASHVLIHDPAVRALVAEEWRKLRETAVGRVREVLHLLPEEMRGNALVVTGAPAEAVVEQARDGYDAILVATHGRKGLSHFWMGSVAERVVRLAEVPVIVLRIPSA
jgi:nucleotide-binding universal stress UspA family protein